MVSQEKADGEPVWIELIEEALFLQAVQKSPYECFGIRGVDVVPKTQILGQNLPMSCNDVLKSFRSLSIIAMQDRDDG